MEGGQAVEEIKRIRDEMRVKLNLAKKDIGDEWGELEKRWTQLQDRMKDVASDSSERMSAVTGDMLNELKSGYEKLRERVS